MKGNAKRGYHRVTPADISTMNELRERGVADKHIAVTVGVSSASVRNHIGSGKPRASRVTASATPKTEAPKTRKTKGTRKPRETAIAKTLRHLQAQGLQAELTIRLAE